MIQIIHLQQNNQQDCCKSEKIKYIVPLIESGVIFILSTKN